MKYKIEKNVTTNKDYEVNEKEEYFFTQLYNTLPVDDNFFIHLYRMSNGTLSVYYKTYPVGKIKLQGRTYSMQILKGLSSVKTIEGDVEEFISYIPDWCRYIRLHCK